MQIIKHFCTITKHRHRVIVHCCRAGILWQGLRHDLSKYSPTEFWSGARYFQGTRSPNERERETKGYSEAWMHHKGRNKHHFEYWTDYRPGTGQMLPVKMPLRYVAEMFCDRIAAGEIYQGKQFTRHHPLAYFLKGKPRRVIHPETSDFLEELLRMYGDRGEKETFAFLRQKVRRHEEY